MAYLDKIGAVIAVHPVKPSDLPKGVNDELPIPAMEFFMDTTRTFTNMVMHNIFGRFPNIKWIFPHAGAFIGILSDRMNGFAMQFRQGLKEPVPLDFKADMKRVYFDVAGFSANKQIHDLLLDVKVDNLLYGSDMPYTPTIACIAQTGELENYSQLSKDDKEKMFTGNAVSLFPKLATIIGGEFSASQAICYKQQTLSFSENLNRKIRTFISKLYARIFS